MIVMKVRNCIQYSNKRGILHGLFLFNIGFSELCSQVLLSEDLVLHSLDVDFNFNNVI